MIGGTSGVLTVIACVVGSETVTGGTAGVLTVTGGSAGVFTVMPGRSEVPAAGAFPARARRASDTAAATSASARAGRR